MVQGFNTRKWWRNPWLDNFRRRLSHLIFVQFPQDLVPVIPQSELSPRMEDHHAAFLAKVLSEALRSDTQGVAQQLAQKVDREYVLLWPGEHYRLLAGFASAMQPVLAIEIGTWQGAAAAILAEKSSRVVTFDIVPLNRIPGAIVDLVDRYPNITQVVSDLMSEENRIAHGDLFREADLVFVDGPKDGVFEPAVVPKILGMMRPGSVMILDDIRFAGMQDLWRSGINYPRIDLGSFGHSSGTGVVFV
jgi:predicted O-methyltransferase YrrM